MFWFACAAIVAFLAWKTKEEAITLPFAAAGIIALTGAWRAAACTALLPFGLLAARWPSLLHLRAAVAENRELASAGLGAALDPVTYFLTSMKGAVFYYLRLYLLPAGQSADPYIKPVSGFADPSFLAATIILASLVALGFAMRSDRLFLFGLMVLLISPLASYAVMPLADVLAEHRIYISGLGFALLAAWVLARLPCYRYATLSGVAVILGIATLIRVGVWTDSLSLWKDAEAKSPELARPHLNLGMAYQAAGIDNLAMEEYRHALAVNPRLAPAYIDMAGLFFSHNDLDSSETALKKAMDLAPALPAPYINLAQVEMKKGKPEEALNTLNRAPLTSLSYLVHINKGDVYAQLGRYKEAVTEYQEGARLKPDLHEVAELVKQRINRLKEFGVIR